MTITASCRDGRVISLPSNSLEFAENYVPAGSSELQATITFAYANQRLTPLLILTLGSKTLRVQESEAESGPPALNGLFEDFFDLLAFDGRTVLGLVGMRESQSKIHSELETHVGESAAKVIAMHCGDSSLRFFGLKWGGEYFYLEFHVWKDLGRYLGHYSFKIPAAEAKEFFASDLVQVS